MEDKKLPNTKVSIFNQIEEMGHEQIVFCNDEYTGLKAIIAVHNTILGPALGGTRMWNYATEAEALTDVLRLSRGMSFKAAISGMNLGGGKAVIIGDPKQVKSEALLRRFGKFVQGLAGKYITAEDVNMSTTDMEHISKETDHVVGLAENLGGGGDPSPVTAYGTFVGMKAAAKFAYGKDDLSGKTVLVQGIGNVGGYLVEYLTKENAKVLVSDINDEKLKAIANTYGAEIVATSDVYDQAIDIYAPCALGATVNDETIDRLKCSVIAGAANNQLADEDKHGRKLIERGIVYAPDFLINAGGLINVGVDYLDTYNRDYVFAKTERIYDTCLDVLNIASKENIPSQEAAIKAAWKRMQDIKEIKSVR